MERQIDIYSINKRALQIFRELSTFVIQLKNVLIELENSQIQSESALIEEVSSSIRELSAGMCTIRERTYSFAVLWNPNQLKSTLIELGSSVIQLSRS